MSDSQLVDWADRGETWTLSVKVSFSATRQNCLRSGLP